MRKYQLWFWLVVFLAATAVALLSVDPRVGLATYGGLAGQEQAWQSVSRLRVFVALHCLFGSLLLTVVGLIGLAFLWRPARLLWLLAVLGYFAYYRLDPRFVPEEWRYLLRGVAMLLLGGVGYYLLVLRSKTTQGKGIFAWRQVALCILMLLGIAGGSYLTSGELYAVNKEFGVSAMLFAAGILLATAWLGEGGELFRKAERTDSTRGLTRKHIVISLLLHSAIFMAICFFTLQVPLSQKLLWTALSPFVPAAAGVYASYTWFLIDGPPQVFSSSADITGNVASEQARLYLGILFQYLTLGCLSAIVLACRNRRVVSLLCSHLLLLCYWLPTVWLMRQISAMFLGS